MDGSQCAAARAAAVNLVRLLSVIHVRLFDLAEITRRMFAQRANEVFRNRIAFMELYHGQSNAEIAEKLFISERIVKAHIHNSLQKMGMSNRVEVICRIREMIDG